MFAVTQEIGIAEHVGGIRLVILRPELEKRAFLRMYMRRYLISPKLSEGWICVNQTHEAKSHEISFVKNLS